MKLNVAFKMESPRLNEYISNLMDHQRHDMNARAAQSVLRLTRGHLKAYADSHHGTASRLGAQPTGHLEKAARNMVAVADGTGFSVTIESPGIQRARRNLTIRPTKRNYLTIPLDALAYGRRVSELKDEGLVIFRPNKKGGGKHNILATSENGQLRALYALVKEAKVPQDANLLPSDDEIRHSAKVGLIAFIKRREGRE
jgi:hypothetical protein